MDFSTSGLSPELVAKMLAVKSACAERCPTCGVGRGRICIDASGRNTTIHAARPR